MVSYTTVDNTSLNVSELFYSIQGESSWSGYPCAFIRLSGCNLRCRYCDSKYTWDQPGEKYSFGRIIKWLDELPDVIVELTGGEPLLQKNIYPFMGLLLKKGRKVLVETNGSLSIENIPPEVSIVLDIKCPDSEMTDRMDWKNIDRLAGRKHSGCRDDIKFVVSSKKDFLWSKEIIEKYNLDKVAPVLFSPVEDTMPPLHLAELLLHHRISAKMQIQLHRLLWPETERGV